MHLQQIFNKLTMDGQALACSFDDKRAYDSLRVSLIRKYTAFADQCKQAGIESYDDKYIAAEWSEAEKTGIFELKDKAESKRVKKTYLVKAL